MWRSVLTIVASAAGIVALFGQTPTGQTSSPASTPITRDNPTPRTGTGVIRGRVTTAESDNGTPIRTARVSVSQGGGFAQPAFTDDLGRFELTALAAGRYIVTSEKTGFARTRYGAKNDVDLPLPVDVVDGGIVEGVEIRMPKGAAVAGRIVDDLGEPVVQARVSVGLAQIAGNQLRVVPVPRPATLTDERGEYRVGGLPAGRYYVSANASPFGSTASWSQTYYDAVPALADATPIVLSAGEERSGVDFTLVATTPARVTVTLIDQSGAPLRGLINMMLTDASGTMIRNIALPISPMTPSLEPGDWLAAASPEDRTVTALARLRPSSGEVTGLNLVARPGATMRGRVVFEGSTAPVFTGISVRTRVVGAEGSLLSKSANVKIDGSFEILNLIGPILLQVTNLPSGWGVRAARYDGRDVLDDPIPLEGGETIDDVQVVLTSEVVQIDGTAVDSSGRPFPGCMVALVPEDADLRFRARRAVVQRTDQNGRFTVPGLLSGPYLLAATPDIDAATWLAPNGFDGLARATIPLTLVGQGKKPLTVPCVRLQ